MLKVIRFLFFLFLVALLITLIYYVQIVDKNDLPSNVGLGELDLVQRYQDSLNNPSMPMEQEKKVNYVSQFEDFEAKVEQQSGQIQLDISKSNQLIFHQEISGASFKQLLSSDLNGDMNPEFWFVLNKGKKTEIFAFEYIKGKITALRFPTLKGRQNFGYLGNDSLHVDKSYIVRSFDFRNDPYADLSEGQRACFYSFGKDQSFVLNKTLDLEHIQQ